MAVIGKFVPNTNNSIAEQYEISSSFEVFTKFSDDGKWWNPKDGAPGFKGLTSKGEDYHVFSDKWDFVPA